MYSMGEVLLYQITYSFMPVSGDRKKFCYGIQEGDEHNNASNQLK